MNCGVDLALSAVIAENAIFSGEPQGIMDVPVAPEILVPRLGEQLVKHGELSDKQLQLALNYQKEQAQKGNPILIGQAMMFLGLIDQATLDKTVTEQILQLQDALKSANEELENRVAERTEDLQQALNRLTELNQLKANFIANISHELRTPLTHIKGYTEMMADNSLGPTSEDQDKALAVMDRAILRLESLINDLIKFSDTSKGQITLRLEPVQVGELVDRVVPKMRDLADQKQIQLEVQMPENEQHIHADPENIAWVLMQLLDNGIKFTPQGGLVGLKVTEWKHMVIFSVVDNGEGIPPERVDEIFEVFHQLDGSARRKHGGTGMGLALVKQILQAHETDIRVESRAGVGSVFSFSLPRSDPS